MEEAKTLGPTGADRVQFVMEANQGQTRGTVDVVASSGEKSRLLLLLETLLPPPQARSSVELDRQTAIMDGDVANYDDETDDAAMLLGADVVVGTSGSGGTRVPPCAVLYDEIDAHVGGRTAVAVGSLLANQGRDSQVRNTNMVQRYVSPDADVAFVRETGGGPCRGRCDLGKVLAVSSSFVSPPSVFSKLPSDQHQSAKPAVRTASMRPPCSTVRLSRSLAPIAWHVCRSFFPRHPQPVVQ